MRITDIAIVAAGSLGNGWGWGEQPDVQLQVKDSLTMGEGEDRCWGTPGSLPRVAGRNHNLPPTPPRSRLTYFNSQNHRPFPREATTQGRSKCNRCGCSTLGAGEAWPCLRATPAQAACLPALCRLPPGKVCSAGPGAPRRQFADTSTVKSDSAQASGERRQGAR